MTSWIKLIQPEEATDILRTLYAQVTTPHGTVDNVMKAHSLRPHTMSGHLALYRSVLHSTENTLPLWFLECVGVFTSLTNRCEYSVKHHFANLCSLINDEDYGQAIYEALLAGQPERVFEGKQLALLQYARKLTASPDQMIEQDIIDLRTSGAQDGEILEVNQVSAYFNYSNRLLNGLGVTTEGDKIGFYRQ